MKRIISLLLSLLLIVSGCCPAKTVARSYLKVPQERDALHGYTHFSDMVLQYSDPESVVNALDTALDRIGNDTDRKAFEKIYEEQLAAYNRLVSATSFAYVRYCQDVTDQERSKEYGKLNGSLYAIQYRLSRLEKELMDRWGYHEDRGSAYRDKLDRISLQDGTRMGSWREREDALCRQYERLSNEYKLTYRGRKWTMAELMDDEDMSLQEFLEALELYQQGKNKAAGEIYLELIFLRRQMAKQSGYDSYAQSQYTAFGRAYTPQQSMSAAQTVKQVFVPLYARLRERCDNDLRYLNGATFEEDQFVPAMEQAVDRVLPGAGEAWRYMLTYGLYDSSFSKNKMSGSFTTYFAAYNCHFLFTQWKDDASSVFTVIHEFGHFLSYYLNPEGTYYGAENLDLTETDAQGLEWLMLGEYDALFGRYASAARLCFLTNALYAILSGFMEDEFQQRAYELQDPSVETLNAVYGELAASYGFDQLFGYEGREWTEIVHTFQFPFYYVSYGASMLGAMALIRKGSSAYGKVLRRKSGTGFFEAVGQDVLAEENIRQLAAWVESTADGWLHD